MWVGLPYDILKDVILFNWLIEFFLIYRIQNAFQKIIYRNV